MTAQEQDQADRMETALMGRHLPTNDLMEYVETGRYLCGRQGPPPAAAELLITHSLAGRRPERLIRDVAQAQGQGGLCPDCDRLMLANAAKNLLARTERLTFSDGPHLKMPKS